MVGANKQVNLIGASCSRTALKAVFSRSGPWCKYPREKADVAALFPLISAANQPKDFVNVEIATTEDRESIQNLERLFFCHCCQLSVFYLLVCVGVTS